MISLATPLLQVGNAIRLAGRSVYSGAPTDGYSLVWSNANSRWQPAVPDHGGLGGLADDDHTQYYNQTRGDARYVQPSTSPSFVTVDLTGITDGYVPYVGASGLAASRLYTDGNNICIGTTSTLASNVTSYNYKTVDGGNAAVVANPNAGTAAYAEMATCVDTSASWYQYAARIMTLGANYAPGTYILFQPLSAVIWTGVYLTSGLSLCSAGAGIQFWTGGYTSGNLRASLSYNGYWTFYTGATPGSSVTDATLVYSADQAAGNACFHTRTENGKVIKLYQQAHIADPASTTADNNAAIKAILAAMENLGFFATS